MKTVLNHRELLELIQIVETLNPPDTLRLDTGTISITVDNASGIGSVLTATVPVKLGDRWGEWTTTITDSSNW